MNNSKNKNRVLATTTSKNSLKRVLFSSVFQLLSVVARERLKRMVVRQYFKPQPYHLRPVQQSLLQQGHSFTFESHSLTMQGWTWGNGPYILFVHGWGTAGIQFQPMMQAFIDRGYGVMTYDAPAHGKSQGDTSSYFQFTDALRSLFAVRQDIVGVVGHSMGAAALVNAYTKDKPDVSLALLAPTWRLIEILYEAFDRYGVPERIFSELLNEYELIYKYSLKNDNPIELASQIDQEVLVVHDREDRAAPFAGTLEAKKRNSKLQLHATEGLRHNQVIYNAKIIEQLIGYFDDKALDKAC